MASIKYIACLAWCVCCFRICVCLKEVFAEEGKEWSLNCVGNKTKHLKNIWWTSNGTILSKCHPGNERCINYDAEGYMAVQSETYRKYTSRLTIRQVGPGHRDHSFHCEDDGGGYSRQSFVLHVYHVPHRPVCVAEEIPHGRIKVMCETSKVYPTVTCEISQQLCSIIDNFDSGNSSTVMVNAGTILYQTRPFKDGTADYNSAICSATINVSQAGLYRFKVKMYPGITNTLVSPVEGFTNNVTIQLPVVKDGSHRQVQGEATQQSEATERKGEHQAEALTDYQNSINKESDTVKSNANEYSEGPMCENSKDEVIKRQLIVILLLTILLVCTFLMHVCPKITDPLCKSRKTKNHPGV